MTQSEHTLALKAKKTRYTYIIYCKFLPVANITKKILALNLLWQQNHLCFKVNKNELYYVCKYV